MNEANRAVREAARAVVVEILGALGVQPQEMDSILGGCRRGRHRTAADEVRRGYFRASPAEATNPTAPPSDRGRRLGKTSVKRQPPGRQTIERSYQWV